MALIDGLSSYYKEDSNWNDSFWWRNFTDTNMTYWSWLISDCAIFNWTTSKQIWTHWLWTWDLTFSYIWWLYVTAWQTRWEFLSMWNDAVANQWIHFSVRTKAAWNNAIYFDYSASAWSSTTTRVTYNAWNFIAITKTGSTITIRIDNNSPESFTKASLNVTNNVLRFSTYDSTNAPLNWKIDEVWIFTTVKTNTEFDSFYNSGNGITYPFPWWSNFLMFF